MITYKGHTISESTGVDGVNIYLALKNSNTAIASNKSLSVIVSIIDEQGE